MISTGSADNRQVSSIVSLGGSLREGISKLNILDGIGEHWSPAPSVVPKDPTGPSCAHSYLPSAL